MRPTFAAPSLLPAPPEMISTPLPGATGAAAPAADVSSPVAPPGADITGAAASLLPYGGGGVAL